MTTIQRNVASASNLKDACRQVRTVLVQASAEIESICRLGRLYDCTFNTEDAIVDISLFIMNAVIDKFKLQIYKNGAIVREYAFTLMDRPVDSYGPLPTCPPMGYIPPGARVRLVVTPDTRTPKAQRDAWFDRLGWVDAEPLQIPAGATYQTYGVYRSGNFALERRLLVNPKYDRPLGTATASSSPGNRSC